MKVLPHILSTILISACFMGVAVDQGLAQSEAETEKVWRDSAKIYANRSQNVFPEIIHADFSAEEWPNFLVLENAPNLKTLVVGGPRFSDDLLLPTIEKITKLKTLILDSTEISEQGLIALKKNRPDIRVLRSQRWAIDRINRLSPELRMSETIDTSQPELREMLGDNHFRRLTRLGIEFDDERGPDFAIPNEALMPIKFCRSITHLDLPHSRINDAGIQYLNDLHSLISLRIPIGEVSDRALAGLSALQELRELNISFTKYSGFPVQARMRLEKIKRQLPNCKVIANSLD